MVLSGTASDGALGVREIKAAGGITIAQEPDTAKYDGMPRAAIATGMVDLVLAARADRRRARVGGAPPVPARDRSREPAALDETDLQRVFALLRANSGVDFTHYKLPTIRRRLHRRMVLHKV